MKISNYPIDEFAVVVKLSRRILRTNGELDDCSCFNLKKKNKIK